MSDQQTPQQPQEPQEPRSVREGSRWYYAPPNEEDIRQWFAQQPLHEGMDHNRYVSGVVIIPATEKYKVTKHKQNGDPYTVEMERAVFTPYMKVDMRIAYFWDLVRTMNQMWRAEQPDEKTADRHHYIGVIEPVAQRRMETPAAFFNLHLPEGFFMYPVRNNTQQESYNRYVGCTQRVAIYERESYANRIRGEQAQPILAGVGTKQTVIVKTYADDNALMKAETSAVGRALGMAGILVVGTGVATAEDMQEAQEPSGATSAGQSGAEATLPPVVAPQGIPDDQAPTEEMPASADPPASPQEEDDRLRVRAKSLADSFRERFPEQFALYQAWWNERYPDTNLSQLSGPALKGAVRKLERDMDAARVEAGGA